MIVNLPGQVKRLHFIGVGGIGMSGLAKSMLRFGYQVSGSDTKINMYLKSMEEQGLRLFSDHQASHVHGSDLVVFSSAISASNPELTEARRLGLTVMHRAELLAHIMNPSGGIAVLGTHGKTTTAAILSHLAHSCGLNPTCFVGGQMINFNDNVLLGGEDLFIAEVDESDGSHALFRPQTVVLTNLERDHVDRYESLARLKNEFKDFLGNLPADAKIVAGGDCPSVREVVRSLGDKVLFYGLDPGHEFQVKNIEFQDMRTRFDLLRKGETVGRFVSPLAGYHNVSNVMASLIALHLRGIPFAQLEEPLRSFSGTRRRLEIKLNGTRLMAVDDYAHHPTEVKATLSSLKASGRRITCIFQPHRYSRVNAFVEEFGSAFQAADRLILTDIYSAGEDNPLNITSQLISEKVAQFGHPPVQFVPRDKLLEFLLNETYEKDLVAFLGAGDITEIADAFAGEGVRIEGLTQTG